ncbi:hypothetical protein F6R98_15060 [Candidatus Methylospira mobilis]|uniref:Calcium-dependent cell adhesion molecule N-terminal domain-containing protein n=2 Tax=Candidatus Methylospira mobilis TaxID=1808979 RepID=A0A5Q0BNH2_9GAMM|nr:hypothetical protein [Candidatus Methylospira mobilis]QFY43781.1 hypothetical protein F6R98_15060 [Candidatus Methylospira mobilis]WNV04771.1 hypothetical protein RP726_20650 [Candidatus Methylospira mobilis]
MNRPSLILAIILGVTTMTSYAGDCWLDVYDKPGLGGSHVRIEGPSELKNLHKLNNEEWSNRIESLSTGPKTRAIAFRQENFKESSQGLVNHGDVFKAWNEKPESMSEQEIAVGPDHKELHLGELGFHRNINSLSIKCTP